MGVIRSAGAKTIQEIIGSNRNYIEIPPFQRSFSWTGDQAKDLFDDITDFVAKYPGNKMQGKQLPSE